MYVFCMKKNKKPLIAKQKLTRFITKAGFKRYQERNQEGILVYKDVKDGQLFYKNTVIGMYAIVLGKASIIPRVKCGDDYFTNITKQIFYKNKKAVKSFKKEIKFIQQTINYQTQWKIDVLEVLDLSGHFDKESVIEYKTRFANLFTYVYKNEKTGIYYKIIQKRTLSDKKSFFSVFQNYQFSLCLEEVFLKQDPNNSSKWMIDYSSKDHREILVDSLVLDDKPTGIETFRNKFSILPSITNLCDYVQCIGQPLIIREV